MQRNNSVISLNHSLLGTIHPAVIRRNNGLLKELESPFNWTKEWIHWTHSSNILHEYNDASPLEVETCL